MARNIKTISQLAHQTAKELNRNPQKWMDCLQTAGRLYQYPFADQLLIYAQQSSEGRMGSEDWDICLISRIRTQ